MLDRCTDAGLQGGLVTRRFSNLYKRALADRGFCDTALMGWLRVCGWHFRIRIKSSLILAAPDGQRVCTIGELKLAARETLCFHNVTITGHHFGPSHGRPRAVAGRQ